MKTFNPKKSTIPINKQALKVTLPANDDDKFTSRKKDIAQQLFWKAPIKMLQQPLDCPDLKGVKFGRFTVLGWIGGGKWQVRCSCGNYAARKTKAIRNPKNNNDCCELCRELLFLKREDTRKRTNKEVTWDYFR